MKKKNVVLVYKLKYAGMYMQQSFKKISHLLYVEIQYAQVK